MRDGKDYIRLAAAGFAVTEVVHGKTAPPY